MIGSALVANGTHGDARRASGVACLGGLSARWEFVTPERAGEYLLNNRKNRRLMGTLAARYGEEMAAGNWFATHQGIAFGADGVLYDGQHRLTAIVASGVGQWLLVTEGLDAGAIEALDRGRVRTLSHALTIMGHKHSSSQVVAAARVMWYGPAPAHGSGSIPDVVLRKFMDRHDEALTFAMSLPKGIASILRGLLARAYLTVPPSRLARFADAYLDLVPHDDQRPEDATARHLRRVITDHMAQGGGSSVRKAVYRKAQAGLSLWLSGAVASRIYEREDDLFPLPGGHAGGGEL